jgi:hypothetical protein
MERGTRTLAGVGIATGAILAVPFLWGRDTPGKLNKGTVFTPSY